MLDSILFTIIGTLLKIQKMVEPRDVDGKDTPTLQTIQLQNLYRRKNMQQDPNLKINTDHQAIFKENNDNLCTENRLETDAYFQGKSEISMSLDTVPSGTQDTVPDSSAVQSASNSIDLSSKKIVKVEKDTDRFEHRWGLEHQPFYKNKVNAANRALRKLILVACVSLIFCLTEAVGGWLSGSLAILTDAAHQLSDVAGFVISFLAIYLTKKPSSLRYSYGYHRADVLGALASILIIWVLLVWLLAEAIKRLMNPDLIDVDGGIMLVTACIGLGCNILNLVTLNCCCNDKGEKARPDNLNQSIATAYA